MCRWRQRVTDLFEVRVGVCVAALGELLRAARLRRKLTLAMVAERVGVSLPTIRKLESGDPSSSLATVLRVLSVLGLSNDIDTLAADGRHPDRSRTLREQRGCAPRRVDRRVTAPK